MATTIIKHETLVGKRIRRKEDPRLITGTATYVDDIQMPGMHHACIVRSPHAAAKIRSHQRRSRAPSIPAWSRSSPAPMSRAWARCPAARRCPACACRITPSWPRIASTSSDIRSRSWSPPIATSRPTRVDLIEVDYEPTQAVADPEKALAPGAPAVHPEWPDNIAFTYPPGRRRAGQGLRRGRSGRQAAHHQPAADSDGDGDARRGGRLSRARRLTLWSSTQIPHLLRTLVAQMLGLPENRMRVITPEVGGGFGSKLNVYAEEALMGFVSMKIGKPVKWIESRRENFTCTIHGRGHVDYYEVAAKKDGTVLGLRLKLIQDLGAYHQLLTPAIPTLSVLMMPGLYKFRNVTADIVGVFTNCVPTDAYRGAGRPEATHGIERMMDMLAAELKMDPAEMRLKNFIGKDEFPYATATGLSYDSGDYAAPLKKALDTVDYHKLREEQKAAQGGGPADRDRHVDLRRDLRVRSVAGDARRRLGERHGEDRAVAARSR